MCTLLLLSLSTFIGQHKAQGKPVSRYTCGNNSWVALRPRFLLHDSGLSQSLEHLLFNDVWEFVLPWERNTPPALAQRGSWNPLLICTEAGGILVCLSHCQTGSVGIPPPDGAQRVSNIRVFTSVWYFVWLVILLPGQPGCCGRSSSAGCGRYSTRQQSYDRQSGLL